MTLAGVVGTIPSVKDNASSPPAAPITTALLTIWIGFDVELTFVQTPPVFGVVPTSGWLDLLKSSRKTVPPKLEDVADRIAMNPMTAQHIKERSINPSKNPSLGNLFCLSQ